MGVTVNLGVVFDGEDYQQYRRFIQAVKEVLKAKGIYSEYERLRALKEDPDYSTRVSETGNEVERELFSVFQITLEALRGKAEITVQR